MISPAENRALQERYRHHLARLNEGSDQREHFDLSQVFPRADDINELIEQVDDLKACLDSFRPLKPEQVRNLSEAIDILYTYNSNRIEGNTLTLQETALVVGKGITIEGKSLVEHLEATNHAQAFEYIKGLVTENTSFSDWMLRNIHQLVLAGIDRQNAGRYRTIGGAIAGSQHVPPEPHLVPQAMEEYFQFYEEEKSNLHPVILAAALHDQLVAIHPFVDGNGRTARLVMNLILLKHGYVIANISGDLDQRYAYYNALETSQMQGDTTPFHRLILNEVKETFFWYLQMVSTSYDESRGGVFFNRIRAFLD